MTRMEYNHLPKTLKNHYILQRHGFSLANNAGIICSDPAIAVPAEGGPLNTGYGLHEKGKTQVKESATRLKQYLVNTDNVVLYASPFKRTMETAGIIKEVLGVTEQVHVAYDLRERWFGDFDMTDDSNYEICWNEDKIKEGKEHAYHAELPGEVCDRATRFIVDIEARMENKVVILVAHGDICQILQTAFMGIEAYRQRELPHVETAQWIDTHSIINNTA